MSKTYVCWLPGIGETRDDAREIKAMDSEEAAERCLEEWFEPGESRMHEYDVIVGTEDHAAPTTMITVEPEARMHFDAWRVRMRPTRGDLPPGDDDAAR